MFHWLLVLCFVGSWLTSGSDHYLLLHVTCGYTIFALMTFRVLWGFVGSRHVRFEAFMRGPAAVCSYLRSMLRSPVQHFTGHNPAGAWAIALMIVLGLLTPLCGWVTYNEWAGDWIRDIHVTLAWTFLVVVAVHLIGVVTGCVAHRENLIAAMFSGLKRAAANEAIPHAYGRLAVILLACVAVLWTWSLWGSLMLLLWKWLQ